MANQDIKDLSKATKVRLWQVAEEMGISESKLSVMLRHELDADKKAEIVDIIKRIKRS